VLPSGISGPEISRALAEGRCTIMVAVPRLYEAMLGGIERRLSGKTLVQPAVRRLLRLSIALRRRFGWRLGRRLFWPLHRRLGPQLRLLASGGARLEPEIAWRLEGLGWQVLTGYGLTETAPILTFNPPGRARLETAGLPVEGVELRIAPPEERPEAGAPEAGPEAPDEQAGQGEIQARGPNVFEGYWRLPEKTQEDFRADGFFITGDIARISDDGYVTIVGRAKDLIISGGLNVYPKEVESVIDALDGVAESAVIGVPHPDFGEGVLAVVRRSGVVEAEAIIAATRSQLAAFKCPKQVAFVEELPRNAMGKVQKNLLRDAYRDAFAGG
jgi:acyl-CoA synthetase (AMP-forming)/AMP-acid ligase II